MLRQIIHDIWKNPISRYPAIFFTVALVFAGIVRGRFFILSVYQKATLGQIFNNPVTYDKGPYGFHENEKRAIQLYQKGIEKLANLSIDTYRLDDPDEILSEAGAKEIRQWESSLTDEAIRPIYNLMHDMELFCTPFRTESNLYAQVRQEERLAQRTPLTRHKAKDIIKYAVTDKTYVKLANEILLLNSDYFGAALAKKPDYLPALSIQRRIYLAVCKPNKVVHSLQTAIDYLEYKTEKELYEKRAEQGIVNAENLSVALTDSLKHNALYKELLTEHFRRSYFVTENLDWKEKQAYDLFLLNPKTEYLQLYVKTLLDRSQVSGHDENLLIYRRVKAVMTQEMETDPQYLYTLAETAYRAGLYRESRRHLETLFLRLGKSSPVSREANRLMFLLDLEE